MRSKTYRASTMKEAMTRVRRDLGGDAVILSAREVRRRRLFGLGSRAVVVVTASDTMPTDVAAGKEGGGAARALTSIPTPLAKAPHGLEAHFGEELSRLHRVVENLSRH